MPAWNDTHYARAQEFTQLLAAALAAAPAPASSAAPAPAPVAPPEPPPAAEPSPAIAPPAPPATGANLFKKIPWKK